MNMTWQPIETAPKDGTLVLLYEPDNDEELIDARIFVGLWNDARDAKFYGTAWECAEYSAFNHYPTHWMPLPEAPKP